MSRDTFWDSTVRELFRDIVAAIEAQALQRDREIALAWNTAALTRVKEMPKLESLLSKERRSMRDRQSDAEQEAICHVIAANFGGKFTPMDPAEYARMHRG